MPDITFHYPQLFVLLLLLPLVWRRLTNRRPTVSTALRLSTAILAVAALAGPRLEIGDPGSDIIVLVDRSASCGPEAERTARELWPTVRQSERPGDRSFLVAFGDGAHLERGGASDAESPPPDGFADASDLAGALRFAAGLRDPARKTAVLCLSDGLYTGQDPRVPDPDAPLDAMPFWYRHLGGRVGTDVAAGVIATPDSVAPNAAWLIRFDIHASAPTETTYTLSRNGVAIARGTAALRYGSNHFFARDTAAEPGMVRYRLDTETAGDIVPGNNAATALLRVRGAPRVLLVGADGAPGLIGGTLAAAAIPYDAIRPERFPTTPAGLQPYSLVILENCPVTAFPAGGVEALALAVEAGLNSLLVTGGPDSFGTGGYHRSAIDPLLPVEMELRNDTHRAAAAVVIAMDRSGSMGVAAGHGKTKMDLANLGAAESIRLLSPRDQVSVIAVDSSPHVVVPLSRADEVERLARLTLGIKAMGGGIYCHAALKAAEEEIVKSTLPSRHILLFADASDAEDQEGCLDLAKRLRRDGIGISVIAMGTERDPDADFLRELARLGGGSALFSEQAGGLPALFTQELIRISRRGFIEEPATPRLLPAVSMLGVDPAAPPPRLDGVNVAFAREGAVVHMNLDDEFSSPVLATRVAGRAQTGAALFQVDGRFSGTFPQWPEAPVLLASLIRRLASGVDHAEIKTSSRLLAGVAEIVLEFAPETARRLRGGDLTARWLGPDGTTLESEVRWDDPETARSTVVISRPGHYLPAVDLGDQGVVAGPPVTLPYSAEFLPAAGGGLPVLRDLATIGGGGVGLDMDLVRRSGRLAVPGAVDIRSYLLAGILLLFLLELSGRRLLWFS